MRLRWTFLSSHQRSGEGKAGPHPSPQPLSSLGRGRRKRGERPKDLAASSIPKGNLPDSQAGHYWPRHLDLGHKCSEEAAQGFLYWCSGAQQVLWPIFVFQSLLPGDWRGVWKGLGPQTKVEQRFSPPGKKESDRRGNSFCFYCLFCAKHCTNICHLTLLTLPHSPDKETKVQKSKVINITRE